MAASGVAGGCPQTVYMEFLIRPIDRLFQGTTVKVRAQVSADRLALVGSRRGGGGCVRFLDAHFPAYFVGTDRLADWIKDHLSSIQYHSW